MFFYKIWFADYDAGKQAIYASETPYTQEQLCKLVNEAIEYMYEQIYKNVNDENKPFYNFHKKRCHHSPDAWDCFKSEDSIGIETHTEVNDYITKHSDLQLVEPGVSINISGLNEENAPAHLPKFDKTRLPECKYNCSYKDDLWTRVIDCWYKDRRIEALKKMIEQKKNLLKVYEKENDEDCIKRIKRSIESYTKILKEELNE